jgi:UTP--glucose-1-phosphate uridylyltransferase
MHVLTPSVMEILGRRVKEGTADLSGALAETARRERYLACELLGRRHDLDLHYGLLSTQLALALAGKDRDEVLTLLVDQLAQSQS